METRAQYGVLRISHRGLRHAGRFAASVLVARMEEARMDHASPGTTFHVDARPARGCGIRAAGYPASCSFAGARRI